MIKEHACLGPEATFEAGRSLAAILRAGDVIGLIGDLGAGKTLLTQGVAAGLGVPESVRVTSPTFSLINEYAGGRLPMVHVDLYRIEAEAELEHIGFEEILDNSGVSSVEWCEKFPVLPEDHLMVTIGIAGEGSRILSANGTGPRSTAIASAWASALGSTTR
ncbi:MAG: tRNA (adenosine(37)-N6)-threonylcarbamoyltransferase complex ATPase subunit type 1 TsaE [Myxococcales bacterium]|nr:tRNA (adenosine(37)-N6)-threonylcarbamoyltransferase complex ATPase subunit type 1 TsaE [Myxococcales bacterium]